MKHPTIEASPAQTPERPENVEYFVERSISARITRRFSSASRASGSRRSRSMVIRFGSLSRGVNRKHFAFQSYGSIIGVRQAVVKCAEHEQKPICTSTMRRWGG